MDKLVTTNGAAALNQVVADWNQGAASWDAGVIAAVYTDDAMLYGGRPGHSVGREAIQAYFASYHGVILSGNLALSDTQLRTLADDCVLVQGVVHFTFHLAGDQHTASTLRGTLVLRQQAGPWRILEHHFSADPEAPPLGDH